MTFIATRTMVLVEDFRLEAFVGHLAPERNQKQLISIGISCALSNPEVPGDKLVNSFDYVPIVERVRHLATDRSRALIETLAEEIAAECFENPHVKSVTVSVRKLNKLPAVRAVGTERTFERNEK